MAEMTERRKRLARWAAEYAACRKDDRPTDDDFIREGLLQGDCGTRAGRVLFLALTDWQGEERAAGTRDELWAEKIQAQKQIEKLANFIIAEIPGEPSQEQGAVDTAIRLLKRLKVTEAELKIARENQERLARGAVLPDPPAERGFQVGDVVKLRCYHDNVPGRIGKIVNTHDGIKVSLMDGIWGVAASDLELVWPAEE